MKCLIRIDNVTPSRRCRLLVLGGKETYLVGLEQIGVDLVLFHTPEEVTDWHRRVAVELLVLDLDQRELVLQMVDSIHHARPIDAVLSFSEYRLLLAAEIGQKLAVRCNPVRPVALTRDKS